MPSRNRSFADFVTSWTRLLQASDANQPVLPDITVLKGILQGVVEELNVITARQDAYRASLLTDAARQKELMVQGRDVAIQLRAVIVSHLGPRNPKLAEFRMRYLGKAQRKGEELKAKLKAAEAPTSEAA
ncbi:MAG: hypothetical protein ACJ76J_01845 [Thermoanaerobaculia bacterium]